MIITDRDHLIVATLVKNFRNKSGLDPQKYVCTGIAAREDWRTGRFPAREKGVK